MGYKRNGDTEIAIGYYNKQHFLQEKALLRAKIGIIAKKNYL